MGSRYIVSPETHFAQIDLTPYCVISTALSCGNHQFAAIGREFQVRCRRIRLFVGCGVCRPIYLADLARFA